MKAVSRQSSVIRNALSLLATGNRQLATLVAALCATTSCGFTPVHSVENRAALNTQIESVAIVTGQGATNQLLKAEIEDQINPTSRGAEKPFTLTITLREGEAGLFINPDGTSGRGDYVLNSAYTLTRTRDGKLIDSGQLNRVSSFNNAQTADFSTFISREDAKKRGVIELARDYKLRLANLVAKLNDPNAKPLSGEMKPQSMPEEMNLRRRMGNDIGNVYEDSPTGF